MADNDDPKSLVARLYKAFNDPGFLGLGGTDENAVFLALKAARDNGTMREVREMYNNNHSDELGLREELDDELSGDDLTKAVALYDEGMSQPPKPKAAGPAISVHGTLTPNTTQVYLSYEDMMKKYHLDRFLLDTSKGLATPPLKPSPNPMPASPGSPSGGTPASPDLPDLGELLTFEKDVGKLHVKIKLPKEMDLKYPVHFNKNRTLELDLNAKTTDSGTFAVSIKLAGSPDYAMTANIGVTDLTSPTLSAGLVFESTKSTHHEADRDALQKTIKDALDALNASYAEYQKPSAETDPVKRYKEKAKILGDMAGNISDIFSALNDSKADAEAPKDSNWNISLGVKVKLDKSTATKPEDKADTIDLTFKAVF